MRKAPWVLVGLLVGLVVAAAIPVGAHHKTSNQRLRRQISTIKERVSRLENGESSQNSRLASLESKMSAAESNISELQSDVSAAETDISSLKSRVAAAEAWIADFKVRIASLESKTQNLSSDGKLSGLYVSRPSLFCSSGQAAVWKDFNLGC